MNRNAWGTITSAYKTGYQHAAESRAPNHRSINPLEKIYGNLNDVVSYEERLIE